MAIKCLKCGNYLAVCKCAPMQFKEHAHYCRICNNITTHIIVDNEWICVGCKPNPEVDDYWNNQR